MVNMPIIWTRRAIWQSIIITPKLCNSTICAKKQNYSTTLLYHDFGLGFNCKKSRLDKDIYNSLGPYLNDATSKVRTGLFAIFQDPILFCNVITPDAKMLNFNLTNLK